jgi:hypothetical protein
MLIVSALIAGLTLSPLAQPHAAAADPAYPFPQHRAYAPGTLTPNHRTARQLDNDVRAAYASWQRRYLVRTDRVVKGTRLFRVALGKPGTKLHQITVSEGQGYGMVIVATMAGYDRAARREFDGLWRFARAHPSGFDHRLMAWHVPVAGEGRDAAFDGDADMAYGLMLAHAQWGSAGAINYRAAANRLLAGIEESMIGPRSRYPMLGDWVGPNGRRYHQFTPRTSDFIPAHFRAFARFTGSQDWASVLTASNAAVDQLQSLHPSTGLLPDFTVPAEGRDGPLAPAPPGFLEGPKDGMYGYNAGRDPWRLATDGLVNGDATSLAQAQLISAWAEASTNGRPARIRAGYRLNGDPSPGSDYFTTFFAAPLGVAAMTHPDQQQWLNEVYDAVRSRREDYYSDSVTLLCLLVMSHNYWDPTAAPTRPVRAEPAQRP